MVMAKRIWWQPMKAMGAVFGSGWQQVWAILMQHLLPQLVFNKQAVLFLQALAAMKRPL